MMKAAPAPLPPPAPGALDLRRRLASASWERWADQITASIALRARAAHPDDLEAAGIEFLTNPGAEGVQLRRGG